MGPTDRHDGSDSFLQLFLIVATWSGYSGKNGKWMSFRVEHPAVQGKHRVIGEQEIEVFQRLRDEECLLDVILGRHWVVHILDSGVTVLDSAIRLQRLWTVRRIHTKNEGMRTKTKKKNRFFCYGKLAPIADSGILARGRGIFVLFKCKAGH